MQYLRQDRPRINTNAGVVSVNVVEIAVPEVAMDQAAVVAICGVWTSMVGGVNSAIGSVCM